MKEKRDKRKLIAGAVLVILGFAVLFGLVRIIERKQAREESSGVEGSATPIWTYENVVDLSDETYGFDHRIETFLFAGTDASGNEDGTGEDYHGAMADYLLLMVLDYTDDTYGCLQIDRNTITLVNVLDEKGQPAGLRNMQICVAHWYGTDRTVSAENLEETVKAFLGGLGKIDGYYVLNMDEIGRLNHAVGGVEVTIGQDLSAADPALTAGKTLVLDDDQAMRFVRSRTTLADDTNVARMGRQKQYMDSLIETVKARAAKDPGFGLSLWDALRDVAVTDMNGSDFSRISQMFLRGENKGILLLEGETKAGQVLGDGIEHEEFYPEDESVLDIMKELFSLVPIGDADVLY